MWQAALVLLTLGISHSVELQDTVLCADLPMVIEEVDMSPDYFAPGKSTSVSISVEYANSYEGWTQYYITSLELTLYSSKGTSSPVFISVDREVPINTYLEVEEELMLEIDGWQDGDAVLSITVNGANEVAGCFQRTVQIGDSGSVWLQISISALFLFL